MICIADSGKPEIRQARGGNPTAWYLDQIDLLTESLIGLLNFPVSPLHGGIGCCGTLLQCQRLIGASFQC